MPEGKDMGPEILFNKDEGAGGSKGPDTERGKTPEGERVARSAGSGETGGGAGLPPTGSESKEASSAKTFKELQKLVIKGELSGEELKKVKDEIAAMTKEAEDAHLFDGAENAIRESLRGSRTYDEASKKIAGQASEVESKADYSGREHLKGIVEESMLTQTVRFNYMEIRNQIGALEKGGKDVPQELRDKLSGFVENYYRQKFWQPSVDIQIDLGKDLESTIPLPTDIKPPKEREVGPPEVILPPPLAPEGATTSERIKGPDPESGVTWAQWLVHDIGEWEGLSSMQLQSEIELLAEQSDVMATEDELRETHKNIRNLIRSRQAPGDEARKFLRRIEERIPILKPRGVGRGAREGEGPTKVEQAKRLEGLEKDSPERQRERAREILDEIESNNYSLKEPINAFKLAELQSALKLEGVVKEVKREIEARLRLQECYALVSGVGGSSDEMIVQYRGIVKELQSRGLLLEGEDFDTLLTDPEGIEDYKVGEAFDLLQEAAINGLPVESDGTVKVGGLPISFVDSEIPEVVMSNMRKYLVEKLGGGKVAEKSLQLAERVAEATFETSVWRTDPPPTDPVAQAIYFRTYREDALTRAGDYGPAITLSRIEGFGTSFFRYAKILAWERDGYKRRRLFNNSEGERHDPKKRKEMNLPEFSLFQREQHTLSLNRIGRERKGEEVQKRSIGEGRIMRLGEDGNEAVYRGLDRSEAEFRNLQPESYGTYLAGYLPGIIKAKVMLLKSDWKPDDFSIDQIATWPYPFRQADPSPTQELGLREYLVIGAFDEGLKQSKTLNWGQVEVADAVRNLTKPHRALIVRLGEETHEEEEKEVEAQFLTKTQMDWVLSEIDRWGLRRFSADFLAGVRGTIRVRR